MNTQQKEEKPRFIELAIQDIMSGVAHLIEATEKHNEHPDLFDMMILVHSHEALTIFLKGEVERMEKEKKEAQQ